MDSQCHIHRGVCWQRDFVSPVNTIITILRPTLSASALCYSVGSLLQALFSYHDWLLSLIFARLIYGVGIAWTLHSGSIYVSEMAPVAVRGLLVTLLECFVVLGVLCGYAVGQNYSWTTGFALEFPVALSMYVVTCFTPRSCRWLLLQAGSSHNVESEAMESLRFIYKNESDVVREFDLLRQQQTEEQNEVPPVEDIDVSILHRRYRAPLRAGLGLVVLQQLTGQPSILSYVAEIFQRAGLQSSTSIGLAAFKLVITLVAAWTVERFGRKTLLYAGNVLMVVGLILFVTLWGAPTFELMVLVGMLIYVGGYQVSFGPCTMLIVSEVFPLAVRGQALAISVQTSFFLHALVQILVPLSQHWFGVQGTFAAFTVFTLCSLWFVRSYVPETRGLSLEQIERQFRSDRMRGEVTEMRPLVDCGTEENATNTSKQNM